jgi:hypothetical protein
MRFFGFICIIGGAGLIALFILHHLIKLLVSGSLLLVRMGFLMCALGFIILALAAFIDKKKREKKLEVEKK